MLRAEFPPGYTEVKPTWRPNGADASLPPKPRVISPAALIGQPPARQWIVPDWLPCGVVTGLYGDGGLGKSLLALQLQTAAAVVGAPWLGLPVEKAPSLGVYCEDDENELWRRQDDIDRDYCIDRSAIVDVHWMPRLGEENLLMTFAGGAGVLTPFHRQVLEAAHDYKARLLIVDTAADTFGGNENDRNQVRQFVSRALGSIALSIGGAVLLCLHPSRAGVNSGECDGGSTGWNNTVRSRLYLRAPDVEQGERLDPHARILQRRKANYAVRNDELRLRWRDGVIAPETPTDAGMSAAGRIDARDLFLALLREYGDQNRTLSEAKRAGNYAPRIFGALPRAQRHGYTDRDFARAMESLFKARKIENVDYGRPSAPRHKIVEQQ